MSSNSQVSGFTVTFIERDYSCESTESLMELCTTLEEMHAQVYEELQKRKLQELHSFVEGMMTSKNENK